MGAPGTTPGPWEAFDLQIFGGVGDAEALVATVDGNNADPSDQAIADADQIAAAPRMYDALVMVKEAVRQLLRNHTHSLDDAHYEAMDAVDTALAAARGDA